MCPRGAQCAPTCPYPEPPRRPARRSRPTRRGPWAMAAKPRSGTPLARVRWPGIRRIHGAAALPVGVAPCTSRGPANRMAQGRSSERRARRQDGGRCGDVPPRVRGRRSRPPRIGPSTGRALDLPSKGLRREAAPGDLDRANHVIEAEPDGDGRQGAAPPRDRPCVPGRWHARRAHGVAARSRGWTRSSAPRLTYRTRKCRARRGRRPLGRGGLGATGDERHFMRDTVPPRRGDGVPTPAPGPGGACCNHRVGPASRCPRAMLTWPWAAGAFSVPR